VVLILGAYSNFYENSFHFDDSHVIETNSYIRSLHNIPKFFTDANTFSSLPQNATYRPLVTLTLAIDYAVGHGSPRAFHVTQVVLLLLLGAMLVAFFTPILASRWLALLAATLFCVHTANTETMNLISARSELLSTIGLLGSFLLYQRSAFARRTLLYLLPLAIGALAKAPLVVFAPLLFAYAYLIEKQPARKAARTALPSLLLGIGLLVFLNSMNSPQWTSGGGSAWQYVMTQPFIWLHYARLFFLPIGLTADTDWTPFTQWYDTRAIAGYAFVALLVLAIRKAPAVVSFGLTWFAIALLPTSIFPLAEVSNEHRIFFAYIGAVLVVATFARRRETAIAAVLAILVFTWCTHARNALWRSEETLWADVVVKSPNNGRAWMNYGLTLMARGDYAGAKRDFDRAAQLTTNYWTLEINQAIVDAALGDQQAAERHFLRALELNPRDHNAHFFYARWLHTRGRDAEALTHLEETVRISPGFADAQSLLTAIRAVRKPASSWVAYEPAFQAGLAAIQAQNWPQAIAANEAATRFNPASADAWNNLGWAYSQTGRIDDALRAYDRALAMNPAHERAKNNAALLRKR
jgi:tetratricopeptide (TPR) repeat protein